MRTKEEIDIIMKKIPESWRTKWCGGEDGPCACMGCVQIGNRISMFEKTTGKKFLGDPEYIDEVKIPEEIFNCLKIKKEEWSLWMVSKIKSKEGKDE